MSAEIFDRSGRTGIFADYEIPEWFDANGIDESWCNDAMPSFTVAGYRVFVDAANPELSEWCKARRSGKAKRFNAFRAADPDDFDVLEDEIAFATDDLAEMADWLAKNPATCPVDR